MNIVAAKKKADKSFRETSEGGSSFDLQKYLRERKSIIDEALEQHLKKKDAQVSPLLHEAMCYGALDAGKRFRPILTLMVGELFSAKRAPLLSFACAIELIHCYSLIHDDLPALDNDDFRRGKPSCHKQFGEAIALLAGDALLTEAFFVAADPALARVLGADLSARLIREISQAAGIRGMISGQSREFELGDTKITQEVLEDLDRLKTGALITTSARVGAMIGKAGRKELERITRYAHALGLAFQITDDILDANEISKDKGAANYLTVTGEAGARERVQRLYDECIKAIDPYGDAAEPLREIARYVTERTQ